jgi:TrmH family RNA methyltransferase
MKMRSLRDRKGRESEGLFLMEGEKFVFDALLKGHKPEALLCTQKHMSAFQSSGPQLIGESAALAMSSVKSPQGVFAAFRIPEPPKALLDAERVLYLDRVQDPDNVGSLVRSAVCAGYGGVLSDEGTADFYSPKAVRSSAGAVMEISVSRSGLGGLAILKNSGFRIYCADASAEGLPEFRAPFALAIGSEGQGASPETAALADAFASVRMPGAFDSLNAAAAGALLMFKSIGF